MSSIIQYPQSTGKPASVQRASRLFGLLHTLTLSRYSLSCIDEAEWPSDPRVAVPVRTRIIVASVGIVFLLLSALFIRHINHPRVVARAVAPDGTEFCVLQTCNWDLEFFTTSCYYRKPGGQWGWFYYDHEDWYWGQGHADVDSTTKRISVYRNGRVTVTFDWESERFRLLRNDFPQREFTGPQELMPVGWSIEQK